MRILLVLLALVSSLAAAAHSAPAVSALAFAPDGTLLVGYTDGAAERWHSDAPYGRLGRASTGDGRVQGFALSADGARVALVTARGVHVWSGDLKTRLGALPRASAPVAFASDGTLMTGRSTQRGLALWAPRGDRYVQRGVLLADQSVYGLSADGRIAATAKGNLEVRVWRLAEARPRMLTTLKVVCWGGISGVRVSPDGRYVSVLGSTIAKPPDGFARVFVSTSGGEHAYIAVGTDVTDSVISADGSTAVVSGSLEGDTALAARDLKTGRTLWMRNIFTDEKAGAVACMALSADGRRLVTAGGDRLRLWDARSGKVEATLP